MKKALIFIVVLVLVLAGAVYYYRGSMQNVAVGNATFVCDQGKAITVTFYSNSVALVLSDGRAMTLPQTTSGSGIRYANADESFVFWSEGNTAFITEGAGSNAPSTFANCIKESSLPGEQSWNTYASSTMGISIRYPQDFTLDPSYTYTEFGPSAGIHGIRLIIPDTMATGTNLSSDSYISVEELPGTQSAQCVATDFLQLNPGDQVQTVTDNGTTYSLASSTGAGAGNRYEEWAWAIPGTSPCTAVRYFIHYGVLDNYPPGMVQQYDEAAVLSSFDAIRESLIIGK